MAGDHGIHAADQVPAWCNSAAIEANCAALPRHTRTGFVVGMTFATGNPNALSTFPASNSMLQNAPAPGLSSFELRVLVVDDDVDGAQALSALLESMGCTTAVAFDGAHALAAALAFDPHLALIDLEMPNMSGCELVCHLHLNAGQVRSSARLVCLTGRGEPVDRRLCIDAGFDDFFTKPLPSESLIQLLSAAKAALQGRHTR